MFCPNGSIIDLWIENRLLGCFVETILVSILALLMIIFGSAQYILYKYHSRPRRENRNPQYRLCLIQIIITCLIPSLSVFERLVCVFQRGIIFDHQVIYMLVMVFVFSLSIKLILLERKSVVLPYFPVNGHGKILLIFWILVFSIQNVTLLLSVIEENWPLELHNVIGQIELAIFICNYILTLLLLILGIKAPGISEVKYRPSYRFSCDDDDNEENKNKLMVAWIRIKKLFKTIVFFLWPMELTILHKAIACVVLLISDRVVNVLILLYCTQLVVSLTAVPLLVRWDLIYMYLSLKFLQGIHEKGLLTVVTRFLWIQIKQHTTLRTHVSFIDHMHRFSLSWHMKNDDNDVQNIMSCGIESTNELLSTVIFNIVPASIDIIVVGIFFIFRFNLLTGLAIWISMISYIILSTYLTGWKIKYENQMNAAKNMCKNDYFLRAMTRLETIRYCVAEKYEIQSYKKAIMIDQYREVISRVNLFMLNVILSTVVCTGLLGTFYFYVNYVDINQLTMEDCILLIIYTNQMYEPLKYFSKIYRPIQINYNNMRTLYSLMKTLPEVTNMSDAKNININYGQIEFRNVSFTYPAGSLRLQDISFIIPPGKTLAVVGPPGSGKTTILKLLLRFYNINFGYIKIDNQNIQSVTVKSLRNSMGVLPQNVVLLNNSIKFNINYGRMGANDVQVISSAIATNLHDTIKQFSDLYDTQVGLKGLKLNAEELQKMAIARLLLKEPDILVLDDISNGLDFKTAREIETALFEKCAKCTKIIVARRLASIAHADEIIVMKYGYIQERGSHEELMMNNDMYARMWYQQCKSKSKLFEQW